MRPTRLKSTARKFISGEAGSTAVIFSISAVALLAGAGAGLDYGTAAMLRTQLQNSVDSAVMAGVSASINPDKQLAIAKKYFDGNMSAETGTFAAVFTESSGKLTGTASGTMPTSLLGLVGIDTLNINASAEATSNTIYEPLCVMAMHPTRKHTLELKGSVSVYAPDCNIYGNSNHEFDVVDPHTPQNFLTGKFVAAIGGGHHFLENVTPPVEFGTELVNDPLTALSVPAPGACTKTNYSISAQTLTLAPGHYCSGLTIENGSKVTLTTGGTYYISGGTFEIDSSELKGESVTIFLTDAKANLEWVESKITLSAKKTGTYAGLAVFGARVETDNEFSESQIDIHGALYMPDGAFEWDNTGEPVPTAKWTVFVVDGFSWVGKGKITINFKLKDSDIPYPAAFNAMPRPGTPRLIN